MPGTDLYALLDVRRDASPAEVRRAYEIALARANRDGATRHMMELVTAYEVLSDVGRRRLYDTTGRAVVPERVPNTFGRAVPFRGGRPAMRSGPVRRSERGHDGRPGARGVHVRPGHAPRRPGRHRQLSVLLSAVLLLAGGFALVELLSEEPGATTVVRVVPATAERDAGGVVMVSCGGSLAGPGYAFAARPGESVSCSDGSVPRWP